MQRRRKDRGEKWKMENDGYRRRKDRGEGSIEEKECRGDGRIETKEG